VADIDDRDPIRCHIAAYPTQCRSRSTVQTQWLMPPMWRTRSVASCRRQPRRPAGHQKMTSRDNRTRTKMSTATKTASRCDITGLTSTATRNRTRTSLMTKISTSPRCGDLGDVWTTLIGNARKCSSYIAVVDCILMTTLLVVVWLLKSRQCIQWHFYSCSKLLLQS